MLIQLKAMGFTPADLDAYHDERFKGIGEAVPAFDLFLVMAPRPENEIEENYDGPPIPGYAPRGVGSGREDSECVYFYRRVPMME